jgi:hypothetical protein
VKITIFSVAIPEKAKIVALFKQQTMNTSGGVEVKHQLGTALR